MEAENERRSRSQIARNFNFVHVLGGNGRYRRRIRCDAGVDHEAKCTVAMRCADRLVSMSHLDGRGVHHQQSADYPKEKTSETASAEFRLRPEHDL